MPIVSLKLQPTVDVEKTYTLNEAGISSCNLIRYNAALPEKLGGWTRFYSGQVNGTPRDLHAWEQLNGSSDLASGATSQLAIYNVTENLFRDITPQQKLSNFTPSGGTNGFTTSSGSATVDIYDPNVTNITTLDTVFFNTMISIGGIILSGMYAIQSITGSHSYTITAADVATANAGPSGDVATFDTTKNDSAITVNLADHGLVIDDIVVFQIPTSVGGQTITGSYKVASVVDPDTFTIASDLQSTSTVSAFPMNSGDAQLLYGINLGPPAVGGGWGVGSWGTTITSGAVAFTYHAGASPTITRSAGSFVTDDFVAAMTIQVTGTVSNNGSYVLDSVSALTLTLITSDVLTNEGPVSSTIVGLAGGWGIGFIGNSQTGTPITTTNWSLDNWGEILIANPYGGNIYYYPAGGGITAAGHIAGGLSTAANFLNAPVFNNGIFVAMPAQILVAWGSSIIEQIGVEQDPLLVRWSDQLDFTNWTVSSTTQAGSFHVPTGSRLMGGIQASQQALLFTDIDVWAMVYQGPPDVFGFNKLASGCGLIGQHAVTQLRGLTFWMNQGNFFVIGGSGVESVPCSVWDYVFQDLDTTNAWKSVAAANSLFDEVGFFFPSLSGGTGEPDKYVKLNLTSKGWDYGTLSRSAWTDQSVLGPPIGGCAVAIPGIPDTSRILYQHEQGYNADGGSMPWFWETGDFVVSEGQMLPFIDWWIPDLKYGTYQQIQTGTDNGSALLTIKAHDYPNEPLRSYGPYTMNKAKQYINTRLRGRQVRVRLESSGDLNSFIRQGNNRARINGDGRR